MIQTPSLDRGARYDKVVEATRHPLVREWFRDYEANKDSPRRTRSALLAAGEQLVMAMTLRLYPDGGVKTADGSEIDRPRRLALADLIDGAACYWLPADLDRLISAMPLPRHRVGKQELPHSTMWICPEDGHGPDDLTIDAITMRLAEYEGRQGILIWLIGSAMEDRHPPDLIVQAGFIPWGARYPEDIKPGSFGEMVLKVLAFLNSPYTIAPRHPVSRGDRRAIEKAGYQEPTVHVIRLRSPIRTPEPSSETGAGRNYRHRWWVRGHFRAQWHPSQQAHQVIWIAPHIKGPDGAEFKASVYAIVR